MSIEQEIIALLSKAALKEFGDYQELCRDYGEESPESLKSWVRRLVAEHQRQKPAGWQNWQAEERAQAMARIANEAIQEWEFMVGRCVDRYG